MDSMLRVIFMCSEDENDFVFNLKNNNTYESLISLILMIHTTQKKMAIAPRILLMFPHSVIIT